MARAELQDTGIITFQYHDGKAEPLDHQLRNYVTAVKWRNGRLRRRGGDGRRAFEPLLGVALRH